MGKVKISVGGDDDVGAGRVAHRLAFENWQVLARLLTGWRLALLRHVRHHPAASVRPLAKALGRDSDVQALIKAGLLDNSANGLGLDYDVIETKIAL